MHFCCGSCQNRLFDFRCVADYYGDPRLSVRIPCRPCMCPGGPGSGFQHSDGCSLDPRTQDVICNCRPGFVGEKLSLFFFYSCAVFVAKLQLKVMVVHFVTGHSRVLLDYSVAVVVIVRLHSCTFVRINYYKHLYLTILTCVTGRCMIAT